MCFMVRYYVLWVMDSNFEITDETQSITKKYGSKILRFLVRSIGVFPQIIEKYASIKEIGSTLYIKIYNFL